MTAAENSKITFAQFSDCHLFASSKALHFGANVQDNLARVLKALAQRPELDFCVFTGDLSQDHSEASYHLFNQMVLEAGIRCPIYWLAGNHDDPELLQQCLTAEVFSSDKQVASAYWQLLLLDSKSGTPAGFIAAEQLARLQSELQQGKWQLLLLHHHPLPVGYFIDRHGLENREALWQQIRQYPSVKAVACGHVHRGMTLEHQASNIKLYTCPATSIEFAMSDSGIEPTGQGPGYRCFELCHDGSINTELVYCND